MEKQWYQSKRLWTGVITFLTCISLLLTGEKSVEVVLPEAALTVLGLVQTILGIATNDPVAFGGKVIGKK